MPRKNEAWGIEVGQYAIKAVRLSRHGQEVHLDDYEIIRFKEILSTPDIDANEQIQLHLDQLIQKHDLAHAQTVVSVPGHLAFARFAKLPPVEPKKIPDIVKFEAVQQIPFPIEEVEWDYQVFQQDDSPDVEVGIFAITKERVAHFLSNYRTVNLRVDALTLSPLAVYNAFAFDSGAKDGTGGEGMIYMDIGTVSTDVIIVENGGIWLRTLPIGGNAFTEALVRAFKISYAKAEKLKREAATSKYAKQIFQAMRGVFADLVQEVQRSLGYYQSLNRDSNITRLVGVGSTFRLPGLSKFLKQQLGVEVVRPNGFEKIGIEGKREADFAEHAMNLATAYGLALQGLDLQMVEANILPSSILRARMWKAKQPWLVAAAACVAVGAGIMGGSYYLAQNTRSSAIDEGGMGGTDIMVKRVLNQAEGYTKQLKEVNQAEDPRQRIENLRRTMDYRALYPLIMQDISEAVATVEPQEPLQAVNFEEIQKIPRNERRRVYIDAIQTAYDTRADEEGGDARGMRGQDMMRERYDPGRSGRGPAGRGPAGASSTATPSSMTVTSFFDADAGKAPRIHIRVIGTTPVSGPETFLQSTIERYLRRNADRPDRPYRLEFGEKVITHLTNVATDGTDAGINDRQNLRGMRAAPGRGEFLEGPDQAPLDLKSIDALLPKNPLEEETVSEDWEFHLEWTVVLRPPIETRNVVTTPVTAEESSPAPDAAEPESAPQADANPDRTEPGRDAAPQQEARS
ncbi:MAG: type IV pilus assembly protein PilM [Planctomycetes bacterium]|jgi:type IV pilus assembly protein PilM|nr:type IV pilus assembly protein PilM [Planctomycetota bacterium]